MHQRSHRGGELVVDAHLILGLNLLTPAFVVELGALSVLALHVGGSFREDVRFQRAHHDQDALQPVRHERPAAVVAGDVPPEGREEVAVGLEQDVQGALRDVQRGQRRQEIVTDEHAQEDKVIHDAFAVVLERQDIRDRLELLVQVLPQE